MARHRIPRVIDDYLQPRDETDSTQPRILLGSAAWYAWLNSEAAHTFSYRSSQITLTVRREQHQSNRYWYAYYSQHGQLRKTYLGKPEKLTPEQLHGMAATLTEKKSVGEEHETNAFRSAPTRLRPASNVSEGNTTRPREETLLTTKFFIPPAVFTLVNRPRLIARLVDGVSRPLTLLTAPAGWGKTTLLSAWHADSSSSGSAVAWVSLDTGDNDPVRFWTYVITALSNQYAGTSETALALLRASQSPSMELVLTTLLNVIAEQPTETVLVLDDYHVIETQPIHSALNFMVEHLPPWLHLVIATRFDPPLPLARLRVRGALTEIRAADLRFTFEETTMFLTEVMKLPFTAEQVTALETRTEGWIAGLQLAAISAQGRPADRLGRFVEAFTGSSRYVMEYLVEEVLQNQTEDIQHFLLHTSMLDRLSGPLCDAVLNKQESHKMLEYLERSNLFIVSLDDEQRWFRYHNLFVEVLRSHLQQTKPRLLPALHHRASIWYEQQGFVAEAVQHVLAVNDFERATQLIEQTGITIALRGQVHMVLGWLNSLPDALLRTRPTLTIYYALMLMFTNRLEEAESRLHNAERCVHADMTADQSRIILGWVAGVRANIALFSGDLARCVALAHQVLDLLPQTEVTMRAAAMVGLAHEFLVSGDVTQGSEDLVAAAAAPVRATGDLFALLTSITLLARLQALQGRLKEAAATYNQASQVSPGHEVLRLLVGSATYYFGLGNVLREWNDLDAAEYLLMQGMELVRGTLTVDANVVLQGYTALALLQQARGNYSKALATLDEFMQLANQRHFVPPQVSQGAAVQAQVELMQGNLDKAIQWADARGLSAYDKMNYAYEREYFTLVRVCIAQGRNDPRCPLLQDALRVLEWLMQDAEAKERIGSVLEILLLRALALDAQGDRTQALIALERALVLAEPEGYIRLLVDEGEPMLDLLTNMYTTSHSVRDYLQTLLAAGNHVERGNNAFSLPAFTEIHLKSSQPLLDPLSERELEVMRLMADGASNHEIAGQLVVAISTIKRHVSNIFSKLSVNSRTQAVARAREIGLL